MKKALLLAFFLFACQHEEISVLSISINPPIAELQVGETLQLTAIIKPDNAKYKTLTWGTSNPYVATIKDGKVTAVKDGEAIIMASAGARGAICKVSVVKKEMRFMNPYANVDFSTAIRVNAISHEHIAQASGSYSIKNAYDRGIRWFASVWYQPAAPFFPYSGWNQDYVTYANTAPDDFSLGTANTHGFELSFEDKDGNTVITDLLPQIPNAEHPKFAWDKSSSNPSIMGHFNVLGNLWSEAGHGIGAEMMAKIEAHPLWDLNDINEKFTSDLLYGGKVFGTINHNKKADEVKTLLNKFPSIFKAMEVFNQYYTPETMQIFKDTYDSVLRDGYRIWCTAVVDWQGAIGNENPSVEKECNFNRGCNVLLMDGEYNSLPANCFNPNEDYHYSKAEAGLDAYIAGRYYASGLGNHYIRNLSVVGNLVTLQVDGSPSSIKAITSNRVIKGTGNTISVEIVPGETYIRFEVYYYNAQKTDMDFIFTNPIFIEENKD